MIVSPVNPFQTTQPYLFVIHCDRLVITCLLLAVQFTFFHCDKCYIPCPSHSHQFGHTFNVRQISAISLSCPNNPQHPVFKHSPPVFLHPSSKTFVHLIFSIVLGSYDEDLLTFPLEAQDRSLRVGFPRHFLYPRPCYCSRTWLRLESHSHHPSA